MEVDLYNLGLPLRDVSSLAEEAERLGFSGLWFAETRHDIFLLSSAAVLSTEHISIGTDVAVAFPRSPMITAVSTWDLAKASDGRFILGLGSQVKAHVERRFSTTYDHPAARLREYILSLRAIWTAFHEGTNLKDSDGDFYSFSLLPEMFSGGPISHPKVPIFIGGVNTGMARLAGEICDGFHVHPLHSPQYLAKVVRPSINEGLMNAGRSSTDIVIAVPVFVAVSDDEEELQRQRASIKQYIGFYGSTANYRTVFETHGWGDLADELNLLQREGRSDAAFDAITDEVVDTFSVSTSWDLLADSLFSRYEGIADRIFAYNLSGWGDPETRERWSDVVGKIRCR